MPTDCTNEHHARPYLVPDTDFGGNVCPATNAFELFLEDVRNQEGR